MRKEDKWYIEGSDPNDFMAPNCFVCKQQMDCIVEVPCETTMHTKCFNEVKNGMKEK